MSVFTDSPDRRPDRSRRRSRAAREAAGERKTEFDIYVRRILRSPQL
jgi:hypothetical protein